MFRWDPNNVGLAGEQVLLRDRKAKAGDEFTYRYYEPQITHPVTVRVAVKDPENVALPGGVKRKLLKVVASPEPLTLPNGGKLQLPVGVFWADPVSYDTIKTVMDIPEIGKVSLVRASKVAALAPNGQVPDLMKRQSIYLKAAIPDMHERDGIVYRVTFQGDALPKELVATDARQAIRNINGHTFDLVITAKRKPGGDGTEKAGEEFLKSNYFLNSDDSEVKKLARQAVGTATDPWKKAQKIEGFVHGFMSAADYTEAMAPADHVARTRSRGLHRVRHADGGHVQGPGRPGPDGDRPGVREQPARQAGPGVPHVDRGVRQRPVARAGRDPRPGVDRAGAHQDHRPQLVGRDLVHPAVAGEGVHHGEPDG